MEKLRDTAVIRFEDSSDTVGEDEDLLASYPFCGPVNVIEQKEKVLTRSNYSNRQHKLLNTEEMAQYELLSRYNMETEITASTCYTVSYKTASSVTKGAVNGELFASIEVSSLTEETAEGRILLKCSSVLIAPDGTVEEEKRKVYEAVIIQKCKNKMYIRLSKRCCEDLNLKHGDSFIAEIQFQLNRLKLCEMHFAIDHLCPSLVFPDVGSHLEFPKLNSDDLDLGVKLNPEQKAAVHAITLPICHKLPPVLVNGPFGTGKTFILAHSVKMILNDPNSRILICTHSQSAADIYIQEYLYPEVAEGRLEATTLLHVSSRQRSFTEKSFVMPQLEDVKKCRVLVTTLRTSRHLVLLGLEKGFFTHIFIDEAAQAMECEAIMPLSLANENTRIVLAGDQMQLRPEVYSQFVQQMNLHTSLLERLNDLYPEDFPCKIFLCQTIQSHEAIIKYTSEFFYNNHLKASGQQPQHPEYSPLTFFSVEGKEEQERDSTSFYNSAEVDEIVKEIIKIKENWPDSWGEVNAENAIGVVTPYYDQAIKIRIRLRAFRLKGVTVERVENVQGKQFRALFLSVVRTRQTCDSKSDIDLDLGFLSNARLINAAITRAQSLVAVVGDPVSMCSVGKCSELWKNFISTCVKDNSFFQNGMRAPLPPPLDQLSLHSHILSTVKEREEAKQQFLNRIDNFVHVNGQSEEHSFQNGHVLYNQGEDETNKQFVVKPDEAFNPTFNNGISYNEINNVNSIPDHSQLRTVKLPYNNVNSIPDHSQFQTVKLPYNINSIPDLTYNNAGLPKSFPEPEVQQNTSMNHNEYHGVRVPFHEMNGMTNKRGRLQYAHGGIDIHSVTVPPTPHAPPVIDKWVFVQETLQNICRVKVPNIPTFQLSFVEKCNLLQMILPAGTNVLKFINNDEQTKAFLQHLMLTEGQRAGKVYVSLLTSIKKDQQMAQNLNMFPTLHSIPDPSVMQRNITASPFASQRPVLKNDNYIPKVINNSENIPLDPASPFQNRMFAMNKPSLNYFINCEQQNQEVSRPINHLANQAPGIGENNPNINGNMLNRPVQELFMQAMSKLSVIDAQNEGRLPNGDMPDDIFSSDSPSFTNFSSDSFSNRRYAEMERKQVHPKRIWMNSDEFKEYSNFHKQVNSPFELSDVRSSQGCYHSHLRGVNNSYENEPPQAFPFNSEQAEERSPTRNREMNGHGPLSMSYPDIPFILSYLFPHSEEGSTKVKQAPQRSENSTTSSPSHLSFLPSLQSNNDSSNRLPQLSSESTTYAKIIRSPQQRACTSY